MIIVILDFFFMSLIKYNYCKCRRMEFLDFFSVWNEGGRTHIIIHPLAIYGTPLYSNRTNIAHILLIHSIIRETTVRQMEVINVPFFTLDNHRICFVKCWGGDIGHLFKMD